MTADPRPVLLDLFCGAGGCSAGYARAGFRVVGVDLARQPDYPFELHRAGAMTFPLDGVDVVHASPPCQAFTALRSLEARHQRLFPIHGDLLTPMLDRLRGWGGTWIVENVPGAPMPPGAVTLCGSSFGLRVRRHRLFASSVPLTAPPCRHTEQGPVVGVYGHGGAWTRTAPGGGGVKVAGAEAARALGIDWTADQSRLSQAIPPAYTEHLGRQLMAHLGAVAA
jgi:DNA (cytosine-5)-methyltransferase 1